MKLRLVLALYAEGSTDKTFLGNVIPRTAVNILAKYGQQAVDVLGIDAKKDIGIKDGGQRILNAARQLALEHDNQYDEESTTYPILIVHSYTIGWVFLNISLCTRCCQKSPHDSHSIT